MVGWDWKLAKFIFRLKDKFLNVTTKVGFSSKGTRVNKIKFLLSIVLVVFIASVSRAGNVIYVDVNGPNDPGTGAFDDPFLRIQDALDTAVDFDIVEIRPGIYTSDPNNYNLSPNGRAVTIRSINPEDPNIVAHTVIEPNRAGRAFCFCNQEDANCIVTGLTIRNGYALSDSGGAIYCVNNSSPTISNCIITNNEADLYGGGIFCYYSSPKITGCTINFNLATDGGGLECNGGAVEITNCIIAGNEALGFGGGVDCYDSGDAILTNCTVADNTAGDFGGGVCNIASEVTVKNSILWANNATQGPQIALVEHFSGVAVALVSYSDVQDGNSAVYDPCDALVWGGGNTGYEPWFAHFDPNADPNLWDFHLQSAFGRWDTNSQGWVCDVNTSPCIDAGDLNSVWTDEPWPNGKRMNMGAYGGTNKASKNGNVADFDVSGLVDFVDFTEFSDKWFTPGFCIEDLTGDELVDLADLDIFAENWLWQK